MSEFMIFRVSKGLGNACAFRFPDGSLGVVDWGTQDPEPLGHLGLQPGTRMRFILATHAHADHTLGLPMLLNACLEAGVKVDGLVYPSATLNTGAKDYLAEARRIAYRNHIPMRSIQISPFPTLDGRPGPLLLDTDENGDWRILVLSPPTDLVSRDEVASSIANRATGNVTSVVLLYQTMKAEVGRGCILLPGDAEVRTLEFARELVQRDGRVSMDCDLFLVPHHGSRKNFPDWVHDHLLGHVAVSATHDSRYHPAQSTLISASDTCRSKGGGQVFCTSYASCCRASFAHGTKHTNTSICFGHMLFEARNDGTSFIKASHDGEQMRKFGHCRG